jgi:hypothetical protein
MALRRAMLREAAMLLFAILFAGLGAFGVYVGLDRIHYALGEFGQFGVRHYGWGLALNSFALAAFFVVLWRRRAKRHGRHENAPSRRAR